MIPWSLASQSLLVFCIRVLWHFASAFGWKFRLVTLRLTLSKYLYLGLCLILIQEKEKFKKMFFYWMLPGSYLFKFVISYTTLDLLTFKNNHEHVWIALTGSRLMRQTSCFPECCQPMHFFSTAKFKKKGLKIQILNRQDLQTMANFCPPKKNFEMSQMQMPCKG